jgi:hypothetical protein
MVKATVKIGMVLLLTSALGWAQTSGTSGASASQAPPTAASPTKPAAVPDADLSELLTQLQSLARQSDSDVGGLRIEKWKTDSGGKQQAQEAAGSIRRNLTNAVPELVQKVQSEPSSLAANFKLYRDLNTLYEVFSGLVETAGAFGPSEQYSPLATDIARLDQLRHKFAERLDQMTDSSDVELAHLRARLAEAPASAPVSSTPAVSKVVVDDNKPAAKKTKKKKPAATKTATKTATTTKNPPPPAAQP